MVTPYYLNVANPPTIWMAYGAGAGSGCAPGYWHVIASYSLDFNVIVANP